MNLNYLIYIYLYVYIDKRGSSLNYNNYKIYNFIWVGGLASKAYELSLENPCYQPSEDQILSLIEHKKGRRPTYNI